MGGIRNEKYHKKLTKKIIKYWNSNWDQENIIKATFDKKELIKTRKYIDIGLNTAL